MARQGFFDSTTVTEDPVTGLPVGDKAEGSDFLADTLYAILGNGVSMTPTSNLLVSPSTGLIVTLKAGKLWKNGYKLWEEEDRDITFTSSASEQTFYISGRLDVANNEFTHDEVYPYTTFVSATDVCVAKIVIPANELTITDAMITDYRYNTTYCGVVDAYRLSLAALVVEYTAAIAALAAGGATGIEAVSYGAAQTLDAAEKAQAIDNIGAADITTISMISSCGVFSGGAVTAQGTPDQTVAVSAGAIVTPEGKRYAFDAVSALAASAADATNPRIDIVYVSSAGVVTYLAGTAAASPAQPSTPANGTILAAIARAANDNTIATADITDQRDFITNASDFEDVVSVTENSNAFACDLAKKHTKNFSFSIGNTTTKTVTFSNVPYGPCDTILTIKATATAAVTWTLDGRTLVWPAGAPTLTSGYTYEILFSYLPPLGKWVGRTALGAAN